MLTWRSQSSDAALKYIKGVPTESKKRLKCLTFCDDKQNFLASSTSMSHCFQSVTGLWSRSTFGCIIKQNIIQAIPTSMHVSVRLMTFGKVSGSRAQAFFIYQFYFYFYFSIFLLVVSKREFYTTALVLHIFSIDKESVCWCCCLSCILVLAV